MRSARLIGFVLLVLSLSVAPLPGLPRPDGSFVAVAQGAPAAGVYGSALSSDGLNNLPLGGSMYNAPYQVQVSWRFRAQHTGLLQSIRPYLMFVDGPGDPANYSAGNGGTVLIQLQTDDGTANHFPSGTILAQILYATPKSGGVLPLLTFPAPFAQLQAGGLYHLVFSNTHPDPYNNFVSLNHLWLDQVAPEVPRQPTVSDTDLHVLFKDISSGWEDTSFINNTPVFNLSYADGFAQGVGYIEVWAGEPLPLISGRNQVRETFTVRGATRTVPAVFVRAARIAGFDALTIRLETTTGALIEEQSIPASRFPSGPPGPEGQFPSAWVGYTFAVPRPLMVGQSYNLVLTAPATSVYKAFPMRKAVEDGFDAATFFGDGRAQQNDGVGWVDWLPITWGTNRYDGDLQFYFTVIP